MPKTFEAVGCEYGTLESKPVDEDVEPLEVLLSKGFGACFGPSNPFDNDGFFFGGFVMRLALLTERFVSLIRLVFGIHNVNWRTHSRILATVAYLHSVCRFIPWPRLAS
jgi:hypothetical protein